MSERVIWSAVCEQDATVVRIEALSSNSFIVIMKHPNRTEESVIFCQDNAKDLLCKLSEAFSYREPLPNDSEYLYISQSQWSAQQRLNEKLKVKLKAANDRIAELEAVSVPLSSEQLLQTEGDVW